jgi:Zn-dependent alcohol dehydrogenase
VKIRAAVLEQFGASMVGLGAVAGCRLQQAERIIWVGHSEPRHELAKGQGATDTWIADENTVARVLEQTRGFTLDDVNHRFELMERQDGIRSVITFD